MIVSRMPTVCPGQSNEAAAQFAPPSSFSLQAPKTAAERIRLSAESARIDGLRMTQGLAGKRARQEIAQVPLGRAAERAAAGDGKVRRELDERLAAESAG